MSFCDLVVIRGGADMWVVWDDPAHQAVKLDLMKASFDASVLGGDIGPPLRLRTRA
ncbi:MAG: hypothetical protein OXG11_12315 [Chloroflexi bacterium]|nr:hypothetical protein [Chloroflexota bacterium]